VPKRKASPEKTTKKKAPKKRWTLKEMDRINGFGYIDELYKAGDYEEILKFMLQVLPDTAVKVNQAAGYVAFWFNEPEEQAELAEHKQRVQKLRKFKSTLDYDADNISKGNEYMKKYNRLNNRIDRIDGTAPHFYIFDEQDDDDEDEEFEPYN
jgi:hypothetical protein